MDSPSKSLVNVMEIPRQKQEQKPIFVFHNPDKMGLTTLENLGNSCFFNSIIQCLVHTIPLSKKILHGEYPHDHLKDTAILWREFTKLVRTMLSDNYRLSPKNFFICFSFEFKKYNHDQEDAQEVLKFILDRFHESLKRHVIYNDLHEDPLITASLKQLSDGTQMSLINEIFLIQMHQRVQCSKCNNVSHSFPYNHEIILNLNRKAKYVNIYHLMLDFCGKEKLEGYNCDNCNTKGVIAYKKTTFWRLPQCMIVVLCRFTQQYDYQGNVTSRKNNKYIDYPVYNMDINRHVSFPNKSNQLYDLYAVSCHVGGTQGGHYYSIVKANKKSVVLNDEQYRHVNNIDDVVCQQAYILFYNKKT